MTRRLLPVGYAVAFALALAVTVALGLGWSETRASPPVAHSGAAVTVLPTLKTQEAFFGDDVTARIELVIDRTRVRDSTVQVRAAFAPYSVAGRNIADESLGGGYMRRVYTYRLRCLESGCLPVAGGRREFRFAPVRVTVGRHQLRSAPWPQLLVVSRLHGSAAIRVAGLREPAVPGSSKSRSSLLLWSGGGLGIVGIAMLSAWVLARERRVRPANGSVALDRPIDPVDDACAHVRAVISQGSWTRRQGALDVLGRVLAAAGENDLAGEAGSLAWRRTRPSELELAALLDRIEQRDNGEEAGAGKEEAA